MAIGARALAAGKAVIELSLLKGPVEKQLADLQAKTAAIGSAFTKVGSIALAASSAIAAPLVASIKLASDAAESLNRFKAVFAEQAEAAEDFAQRTAKAVGRSAVEIRDSLATFQGFFLGLGFKGDEARKMSEQLSALAIDFASFNNLSDQEAVDRFISALSGSSEVLDRWGVNIRQSALEQELLSRGINKAWTEVTEQEKAISRLNTIMKVMTDQGAVGDAVKTAGSFANQLKALRSRIKDTAVEIGTTLLPIATEWLGRVLEIAKAVSTWVSENKQLFVSLATTTAKVAAVGVACIALGKTIAGLTVTIKALRVAVAFLSAHPLVALVSVLGAAAVAALHFTGALDNLYARINRLMGMPSAAADEFRELTDAMKAASQQQAEFTLAEKIVDMERQIRESESRIRRRERNISKVQARAPRTGEIVDPADLEKLGIERRRLQRLRDELVALKNLEITTPTPQQQLVTEGGAEPITKSTPENDPLGFGDIPQADAARKAFDFAADLAAEVKKRLTAAISGSLDDAQKKLEPLKVAAKAGIKTAVEIAGAEPQALLDTRLAHQLVGGSKVDEKQLEQLISIRKGIQAIESKPGGIPFI
jgi:hypothetical protein